MKKKKFGRIIVGHSKRKTSKILLKLVFELRHVNKFLKPIRYPRFII